MTIHKESDSEIAAVHSRDVLISIHALHEESDPGDLVVFRLQTKFQSTLSMRRATAHI